KEDDAEARTDAESDAAQVEPDSVATGRSLAEIATGRRGRRSPATRGRRTDLGEGARTVDGPAPTPPSERRYQSSSDTGGPLPGSALARLPGVSRAPLPAEIEPALAVNADRVPAGDG